MDKQKALQQELWFRGNLSFKLHATQKIINQKFNDTKGQLFVGNCSRQLGKSFWGVTKCIEQALKHPKSQIRYGAAFQSDLVDFIIPAFHKILEDCPPSICPKYKVQGSKWVFPNGSEIKLCGLDKSPNSLRGNTLDLLCLDEVGFVSNLDYIYKSVIIPATTHRPNAKIILISTPPNSPDHPFTDYCNKARNEGGYAEFNIYTNPLIDQNTIDRLANESGGITSSTFLREYMCQFVLDSNSAIVPEWKDDYVQVAEKDEYFQYYHKLTAMDMGRVDDTALIFGYYDFKKATLFIQDELIFNKEMGDWTTLDLKDGINKKELELWNEHKPLKRIADSNNPHLLADLSTLHNVQFQATSKISLEAMVNELRLMIGDGRIVIDPKCVNTIGCLKFGIWDKNRSMFARSKAYGHYDALAALIYLVRNLPKHSNPIPADHGHAIHRSFMGHIQNTKSNSAKALTASMLNKRK